MIGKFPAPKSPNPNDGQSPSRDRASLGLRKRLKVTLNTFSSVLEMVQESRDAATEPSYRDHKHWPSARHLTIPLTRFRPGSTAVAECTRTMIDPSNRWWSVAL